MLSNMAIMHIYRYFDRYWDEDVATLVNMVDDINFELPCRTLSGMKTGSLLLHATWAPEHARMFIEHCYTAINQKDSKGETALMKAAGRGYQTLIQYYLELGILINDQDDDGYTSLMRALWALARSSSVIGCRGGRSNPVYDYTGAIKLLLQSGAVIFRTDSCQCPCSGNGCTAIHLLPYEFSTGFNGPNTNMAF